MNDTPFDPRAALAELRRLAPAGVGRKLSLARRCAAYAALWHGLQSAVVAQTFNLSKTSVSHLAGCRNDNRIETTMTVGDLTETFASPSITKRRYPERKPRYQDVAREWTRLGETEFLRIYYTRQIDAELRNTMREMGMRV